MSIEFTIADRVVEIRIAGSYTTAELRSAIFDALSAGEATGSIGLLFDVSESESLATRTREEVVSMAYFLANQGDRFGSRVALVGAEDFPFSMMRVGGAALERRGITNQVFRAAADGRKWLTEGWIEG